MKTFKIIVITLLITALSTPAFAWRGYRGPSYYPRYGYGCGVAAGAGIAAGAVLVGVLAAVLIGKAVEDRTQAELNMLDAAARANQYENYLIALSYYNRNSKNSVTPFDMEQWYKWRSVNGLEALR